MNDLRNRPLSELEQRVKEYVKEHPGLTAYDIANVLGQSEEVYSAIAFLVFNAHVRFNTTTSAITPYE